MPDTTYRVWIIELWVKLAEAWLPAHMYVRDLNPIETGYLDAYVTKHGLPVDNVRVKRIRTIVDFQAVAETLSTYPGEPVTFPTNVPPTGATLQFDDGNLTLACQAEEEQHAEN